MIGIFQREADTLRQFTANDRVTISQHTMLFVSCTLGFCLSVSAFQLNRLITPTSITILNNTNKFAARLFYRLFYGLLHLVLLHSHRSGCCDDLCGVL